MNSLGERLKFLRKSRNLTQAELAENIEISRANISKIEKNEISPLAKNIVHICTFFNVSTDWLLLGKSTMDTSTAETNYCGDEDAIQVGLSVEQETLLHLYDKLSIADKKNLQKTALDLLLQADSKANSNKLSHSEDLKNQVDHTEAEEEITATKVG